MKVMTTTIVGFVKAPRIPWFVLKKLRVLKSEFRQWSYTLLLSMPGRIGARARRRLLPFGKIGKNVRLERGSWFEHPENITIGDDTGANRYCFIHAGGGVEIGRNVMLGPFVTIYSQNHNWRDRGARIADQGRTRAKVVIEDDVWLCAGSVVLPGVKVRKGTVVAAGAVVTRDTEPYLRRRRDSGGQNWRENRFHRITQQHALRGRRSDYELVVCCTHLGVAHSSVTRRV